MSPEIKTRKETAIKPPISEICADPEILLKKMLYLSEHPEDSSGKAMFREWLLKDWQGINEFMLQYPSEIKFRNEIRITRAATLNNYDVYSNNPDSKYNNGHLIEYFAGEEGAPKFVGFAGIDGIKIGLSHQSDKTDACKEKGEKDIWMNVTFVADSKNRNNLIGLSIKVYNDSRDINFGNVFGNVKDYFELRVSPKLDVKKLK